MVINVKLTHPEKILYPHQKITKAQFAQYFDDVQEFILPYTQNRLLTLVRCPQGQSKECFFQKHRGADSKTKWIYGLNIKDSHGNQEYLYIKNSSGLFSLAQLNVLEIHPWGSQIKNIEKPDIVLFDLDPAPSVEWKDIVRLARIMQAQLEKLKAELIKACPARKASFERTSCFLRSCSVWPGDSPPRFWWS